MDQKEQEGVAMAVAAVGDAAATVGAERWQTGVVQTLAKRYETAPLELKGSQEETAWVAKAMVEHQV